MRRRSAFTLTETLAVVAVVAVLSAIVFPAVGAAKRHGREPDEIARLRQVFLGLAMYEDETGEMPPALGLARPYVGDSRVFATAYPVRPHPKQGPYPAAAFVRDYPGTSPFPIDFGYLKTYPPNDENRTRWRLKREEPLCGLIASPWAGEPFSLGSADDALDGPLMRGPVLRIKMDGSLYRLAQNPYSSGLGDVNGLFYHPLVKDFYGP